MLIQKTCRAIVKHTGENFNYFQTFLSQPPPLFLAKTNHPYFKNLVCTYLLTKVWISEEVIFKKVHFVS